MQDRMMGGAVFYDGFVLQAVVAGIPRRVVVDVLSVFPVQIRTVLFVASVPGPHAYYLVVFFPVGHRDDGRMYHYHTASIGNVFLEILAYGLCPCSSAVVDDD